MKRIKLNKKRQLELRFNYLFNKRSNYLKSLPKLKNDGIKEIENEKAELLIDKFLGLDRFQRDYSFFNPPLMPANTPSKEDPKKRKIKLLPNLKILITSPLEKEEPERYRQKDYLEDNFSNIYKNSNKNFKENNRLCGSYRPLNKNKNMFKNEYENYLSRNEKQASSSFLSGIGKQIISENNDKEDNDTSIRVKFINHFTIK